MFITNYEFFTIPKAETVEIKCSRCGNKTKHFAVKKPVGIGIGLPFAKRPLLSAYHYYLVCPICRNPTKKINKDQLDALIK